MLKPFAWPYQKNQSERSPPLRRLSAPYIIFNCKKIFTRIEDERIETRIFRV
jgi:hypothetical protein